MYLPDTRTVTNRRNKWSVDPSLHPTVQLTRMARLIELETCAIPVNHRALRGIPDLVFEANGSTLDFVGLTLLFLDISDPTCMVRLLPELVKATSVRLGSKWTRRQWDPSFDL